MVIEIRKEKKMDHIRWVHERIRNNNESRRCIASSDALKFLNFLCIKDTFLELPPEQWEMMMTFRKYRR